jgi:hypothetical protein
MQTKICRICGCEKDINLFRRNRYTCKKCFSEYTKDRKIKLLNDGLCYRCGSPRGVDGTDKQCRTCTDKISKLTKDKYINRTKLNLCPECGSQRDSSYKLCLMCRDKHNIINTHNRK